MSGCPACGRPLALARATCLYCGASLPTAAVEAAQQARAAVLSGPAPASLAVERRLLGLRLEDDSCETLASALDLPAYDARRIATRGGDHLWRLLPAAEAEAEARRLAEAGLRPWTLPEAHVRAVTPHVAVGGRWEGPQLRLRTGDAELALEPGGLLLVVQGPIARELPAPAGRRLIGMASPLPGYRFHLHARDELRPVEVDPDSFELAGGGTGAGLLLVREWLGGRTAIDDGFRQLTPALAPATQEDGRAARWADSLAQQTRGAQRRKDDYVLLDNLAQFRFYSAWRGLLARARA